jgi:DNA-binding YbaB/EbfC family protein
MSNPFDMLGGMGGLGGMMASFQQNVQTIQQEISQQQFTVETGSGLVSVTVSGNYEVLSVDLRDEQIDDADMISDLIRVATNQALKQAKAYSDERMASVTAGLPIPPGMMGMLGL